MSTASKPPTQAPQRDRSNTPKTTRRRSATKPVSIIANGPRYSGRELPTLTVQATMDRISETTAAVPTTRQPEAGPRLAASELICLLTLTYWFSNLSGTVRFGRPGFLDTPLRPQV